MSASHARTRGRKRGREGGAGAGGPVGELDGCVRCLGCIGDPMLHPDLRLDGLVFVEACTADRPLHPSLVSAHALPIRRSLRTNVRAMCDSEAVVGRARRRMFREGVVRTCRDHVRNELRVSKSPAQQKADGCVTSWATVKSRCCLPFSTLSTRVSARATSSRLPPKPERSSSGLRGPYLGYGHTRRVSNEFFCTRPRYERGAASEEGAAGATTGGR